MFTVVLYEPEIPQNTGNIIRLCANMGVELHLVKPLGFPLDSSKMKRAGLDYHEFTKIIVHENFDECLTFLDRRRIFALTTKGTTQPNQVKLKKNDVFLFGPETRGLPLNILDNLSEKNKIRLPMLPESRSMNLSNTVAIILFEAWRQNDFIGGI